MTIKFAKKRDKHVISCLRTDGSSTWMQTDAFFVQHDLMHYAVETTLHFKNAFFGMLAGGISISDFELPKDQRPFAYSEEALVAESIVNLLSMERLLGPTENFNEALADAHRKLKHATSKPHVDEKTLANIRLLHSKLLQDWNALPLNEALVLHFEE
ncbi:MAG TPA: hypothetical protein PKM63_03700 [Panacibacter sp.]|nr:hypothetical protein [Panacibacter sp.]HNP43362.1 hypothetical protein [Panacibacter sp.]